jgi:hypothetical protein
MRNSTQKQKCINKKTLASLVGALLVCAIVGLIACGTGDDVTTPTVESGTIGPDGGTASDKGGASVTIPPGALSSETAIEVATYVDSDACPVATGPVPEFAGGARFGPHGLQFAVPATVTIPSNRDLTPGSTFPLCVWNETEIAWEQTEFVATVAADGKSFSAPVTHFSIFGGFGGTGGGIFGDIDDQLCTGGSPSSVMADFIAQFKRDIADVGDKGIYNNQCKEVTGLDFDIGIEIEGNHISDFIREGETADESIMFVYTAECGTGQSAGGYIDATVVIYYECTAPDLTVTADPSRVEQGGSSTVMATLKCGAAPYPGQAIQFECFGDGDITSDQATTNPAGQAQTMYNAPDKNGEATVKAYHDACAGEDNATTVMASAAITVGNSWNGTMTVTFSHPLPDPPLLEFADVLTINFDFDINEGIITGTGTGYHAIDITPGGNCQVSSLSAPSYGFSVTGSATEQTLQFMVVPNGMMPINFVITCWHGDDQVDYPYPPYGALEGAIITTHISVSMARENDASDSGSGSEDWGEGLPMHYSYNVTVNEGGP